MSLMQPIATKIRAGGPRAVQRAVARRYVEWQRVSQPLLWSRVGRLSRLAARLWPLQPPSVLILSLPRSGSSWVGHTLSNTANAAYLREPLTQSFLATGGRNTIHPFDFTDPPAAYQRAAPLAFLGLPDFRGLPGVIPNPQQWSLATRRQRRLVIKEVNPYVCPWLSALFKPRVIFIVRHPAAVALSFRKLKWWTNRPDPWCRLGRELGAAHGAAWQCLRTLPQVRIVHYETLCTEPAAQFAGLAAFAELQWDNRLESELRRDTTEHEAGNPWSLRRDSRRQIDGWRTEITAQELTDLRMGYTEFELPWYQSSDEW